MVRVRRAVQRTGQYIIMNCNIITGRGGHSVLRHILWQYDYVSIEDLSIIYAVSKVLCPFLVLLPF